DDYGRPSGRDREASNLDISTQVSLGQRNSDADWSWMDMMPDWAEQWNWCIAPCQGAACRERLRKSPAIALGELFQRLGTDRTSWSMGNPTHGDKLVGESAQVKGLPRGCVAGKSKRELPDGAVHFAQLVLLGDLRPPWLTQDSPRALPGKGVLSRFAKLSLLQWPAGAVAALFGEDARRRFSGAARSVDLELAGVIARPLRKITEARLPRIRREPALVADELANPRALGIASHLAQLQAPRQPQH
ncbi:unnamed protein product, partial [Prorocentrum cordatum]